MLALVQGRKRNYIRHYILQFRRTWIIQEFFEEILQTYTSQYEVVRVKTTNMGSLFKLTYNLTLKNKEQEKEFIDELRCRNGNLEITMSKQETAIGEL